MKKEIKLIESRIEQLENALDSHQKTQIKICACITGIVEELDALNNILDMLKAEDEE